MSNGPIKFQLLERVLKRQANRDNKTLPELSIALSKINDNMVWEVRSVDDELIATVDGERVEWHESV